VLLSGDAYVRLDACANDDLERRLGRRGLRVLLEPLGAFIEYMLEEASPDLVNLPTGTIGKRVTTGALALVRQRLYERAREKQPWLPMHDAVEMSRLSREALEEHPGGEAAITLGSVLHHWQRRRCDGVVVASPWGCAPALVAESLLRHRREIPTLFVYADGSPIDERRLAAFALRLRGEPGRCETTARGR
jgi:predicted nucleotide-binding protein (sugar kinase/HSP70/actin superfamily)